MDHAFGSVVREVVGEESLVAVSRRCGLARTSLYEMLAGRVPLRPTLCRFADALELTGTLRQRLFRAAGYLDPREERQPADAVA